MKTKFLSLLVMMALALNSINVMAQTQDVPGKKENMKKPSREQMLDRQVMKMEKELLLDDGTAEKFKTLYKEYLNALYECRHLGSADPDNKLAKPDKQKIKEKSDAELEKMIQGRLETQKKVVETKQAYFEKFKNILNAKQLQKVFAQGSKLNPHVGKARHMKPCEMGRAKGVAPGKSKGQAGGKCIKCEACNPQGK